MLNADAPEFFASSILLLPSYNCFSSYFNWNYHQAHWYHWYCQAPLYPYRPPVPNGSSLQYVEGMVEETGTKSSRNCHQSHWYQAPLYAYRPPLPNGSSLQYVEGTVEETRTNRSRNMRGSNTKVVAWRPKSKASQVINVKVPTLLEFKEEVAEIVGKTTVMIRNIPNKCSRNMLIDLLDKHCEDVNQSLAENGNQASSTYDFVYLPMDFKTRCNLGYAFVNFTTPVATTRLYRFLHKSKWPDFCSKKICQITYARIQGNRALKAHFSHSKFLCDSDEFLPIEFSPPRDGFCAPAGSTKGERVLSQP